MELLIYIRNASNFFVVHQIIVVKRKTLDFIMLHCSLSSFLLGFNFSDGHNVQMFLVDIQYLLKVEKLNALM